MCVYARMCTEYVRGHLGVRWPHFGGLLLCPRDVTSNTQFTERFSTQHNSVCLNVM